MLHTNIRPYGNRLLIKPLDTQTKTASGIMLPGQDQEDVLYGEVIAAGSQEIGITTGDEVIVSSEAGYRVHGDGYLLRLVEEKEVLATTRREV